MASIDGFLPHIDDVQEGTIEAILNCFIIFAPPSKFIEMIRESSKLICTSFETQSQRGAETCINKLIN